MKLSGFLGEIFWEINVLDITIDVCYTSHMKIKNPKRIAAAKKAWITMKNRDVDRSAAASKANITRKLLKSV